MQHAGRAVLPLCCRCAALCRAPVPACVMYSHGDRVLVPRIASHGVAPPPHLPPFGPLPPAPPPPAAGERRQQHGAGPVSGSLHARPRPPARDAQAHIAPAQRAHVRRLYAHAHAAGSAQPGPRTNSPVGPHTPGGASPAAPGAGRAGIPSAAVLLGLRRRPPACWGGTEGRKEREPG